MKELVIFDLDKTLIKGYSQQIFLKYLFKTGIINFFNYFIISIWFIFYKLGLVKSPKKIMEYAFRFMKGWDGEKLNSLINDFFEKELKHLFFKDGVEVVNNHKKENRELLIVSNVPDFLVKRIALYLGVNNYIGTKLEIINGKLTSKIAGDIVYGENKTLVVKDYVSKNGFTLDNSWAYGDHISDLPILSIVNHPYAINPSPELRKEAEKRNWPIILFNN